MIDLNELTTDPSGFEGLVMDFPEQVARAHKIASEASLPSWSAKPDQVVLAGMGGSAAGGDFVQALFDLLGSVPFAVSRTYSLPSWVGNGSLVFITSYSGNTEETLSAYQEAKRRGANIIAITSGGKVADLAREDGFPVVIVPGGQPPRTALGYMLIPVVVACERLGLLPKTNWEDLFARLAEVRENCRLSVAEPGNLAKELARDCVDKVVVCYAQSPWTSAVATRWRGQINENSKMMCLTHVFPELCHNEILGWEGAKAQGRWKVVLFEGGDESNQMKRRVAETLNLIGAFPFVLRPTGESLLTKMLTLAYFGDFVSIYLAELMGQDPAQMKAIDELKARLA